MSVPICFVKVKDLLKTMNKNVPDHVLRDLSKSLSEKQAESMGPEEFNKLAKELFTDHLTVSAAASRTAKLINLQKIEAAHDVVTQDIKGMNVVNKVEAWILGNSRRIGNATNLSVQDMQKVHVTKWLKAIRTTLESNGDLKLAESGLLRKEITQELANLESGGAGQVSDSAQAYRIARTYNGVLSMVLEAKKSYDPFMGKIQDYFHRASHDRVKITNAGKDEWVSVALQNYGEKSFPELHAEAKVAAFENVYNQIVKGTYESQLDINAEPGDVMRRMAKSRTLIPNNWESFYEYNSKFGRDNVHTSVLRAVESAAHDIAVIQKFGALPQDTFNGVMRRLVRNGTAEDIDLLKANERKLEDYFRSVTERKSASTGDIASFTRGAMAVNALTKLGSPYLRSISDLANAATMITDSTGGNYLSNFAEAASSYIGFFAKNREARITAAEDMGLFSRSALHGMYQELGGESSAVGTSLGDKFNSGLNTMLELNSKWSLMDRHISAMDAGIGTILSRRFGLMTERAFVDLSEQTKGTLKRYGIGNLEWSVIRKGTEDWSGVMGIDPSMGRVDRMLNMDGMAKIPDEVYAKYAVSSGMWKGEGDVPSPVITRARIDVESKLGALISQHADSASSTAGATERALMYRNTDPNSAIGASARMLWQFKSAMVKNYDTIMRSYYSNPDKLDGDFTKVARHITLATGLYVMGDVAKTLLEGKTPEDVTHPKYIAKAILSSGAGGVFGDSVLSELTRNSNWKDISWGAAKSIAGPTISTGLDAFGVAGQSAISAVSEKTKFPGNQIGKLISDNIPYHNLFYTKSLYNYIAANSFREWLSPGYASRLEDAVNTKPGLFEENQRYLFMNPNGGR